LIGGAIDRGGFGSWIGQGILVVAVALPGVDFDHIIMKYDLCSPARLSNAATRVMLCFSAETSRRIDPGIDGSLHGVPEAVPVGEFVI
jgi:hypothetical protein